MQIKNGVGIIESQFLIELAFFVEMHDSFKAMVGKYVYALLTVPL